MELGGPTPGRDYDVLDVAGRVLLDGRLEVSLLGDFQPQAGQTLHLFDWGTLAGTFEEVDWPSLGSGLAWDASGLYEAGRITVVPEPSALAVLGLGLAAAPVRRWRQDPARTQEP
jgi:hypothetical protein